MKDLLNTKAVIILLSGMVSGAGAVFALVKTTSYNQGKYEILAKTQEEKVQAMLDFIKLADSCRVVNNELSSCRTNCATRHGNP